MTIPRSLMNMFQKKLRFRLYLVYFSIDVRRVFDFLPFLTSSESEIQLRGTLFGGNRTSNLTNTCPGGDMGRGVRHQRLTPGGRWRAPWRSVPGSEPPQQAFNPGSGPERLHPTGMDTAFPSESLKSAFSGISGIGSCGSVPRGPVAPFFPTNQFQIQQGGDHDHMVA